MMSLFSAWYVVHGIFQIEWEVLMKQIESEWKF